MLVEIRIKGFNSKKICVHNYFSNSARQMGKQLRSYLLRVSKDEVVLEKENKVSVRRFGRRKIALVLLLIILMSTIVARAREIW